MEQPITPELLLLAAYIWILLLGGLIALVMDLRSDVREQSMKLRAWNVSWVDFALYGWALVMLVLAAQSTVAYLLKASGVSQGAVTLQVLVQGITFHGVTILLIILAYRRKALKESLAPILVRMRGAELFRYIVLFFFSGIFLAMLFGKGWEVLLNLLADAGWMSAPEPQELVELFAGSGLNWKTWALIFLAVVVAPISEEFIFRVGLYRFLKGRFSPRVALLVSSGLFASMHFNLLSFLPLFLIGMLLCRSYERTGNVLVPIGFHALFNANNIAMLLLIGPQVAP